MLAVALLIIFIFICPLAAFYFYRRFFAFNVFVKEGVPGPKPHWLLGNAASFANKESRHLVLHNWTKQFGKFYGYYEGSMPVLVTSDTDFIAQVFIKQFPSFHGRKLIPIQNDPDSPKELVSMFTARGDRWKRLRTIVNPTFSASKLRALQPLMDKCQRDFMNLLQEKAALNPSGFELSECFKYLTLDTIAETAFGVELDSCRTAGKAPPNPMLAAVTETFSNVLEGVSKSFMLAIIIPEIAPFLRWILRTKSKLLHGTRTCSKVSILLNQVISQRKADVEASKRVDLLQMMLELEERPDESGSFSGFKGLTVQEIQAQASLFMLAGYETSSNALSFVSYLLATNPEVQAKLLQEIDLNFAEPLKKPDYDSVQQLPYLDAVINEALRLYPVGLLVVNRLAMEDTQVNGIVIPKGVSIAVDLWSVHRDEELWGPVDPNLFHPERFFDDYPTKESRGDAAFLPFGFGPRICIGQRFAQLEIKLTLVNMLRRYRIEKTPKTGDQLDIIAGFTLNPKNGVWVKLTERS